MRHVRQVRHLLEGLLAAGLGLGGLAALVLLLWTLSPHPHGGADGALRIAADLWLLAHGTELTRGQAPVGVTPLLLSALPAWLLFRAVRAADWRPEPDEGARAALWTTLGYLIAATAAVLYTLPADISAKPLSAAVHVPLFALVATFAGAWSVTGPPEWLRELLPPALDGRRLRAATRVAFAALVAYGAGGALLAIGGLVLDASAAQNGFGQLSADWPGRLAVLLLTVALLPNAALWGASYGLGPGFTPGGGATVAPLAFTGEPLDLPPFPLLAALPSGTPDNAALWVAVAAVPAVGVVATAWYATAAAVPVPGERRSASGWAGTALTAALAAGATGVALGVLAAYAGGPLGTEELAAFGPDGWLVAGAAFAWSALVGVPLTLALRAWRLRRPRWLRALAARAVPRRRERVRTRGRRRAGKGDAWHTTVARRTRWAALKKSSGALVEPEGEPRP
ncbi:DUF6350 family protein [Streptomyces sp. PT12]|uniref:cell division protein PerM n=1 Tax=Streptomyces sp. PT12 TaxID=1510197 RepID=UPI00215D4894|nr:DUF6350 family protein [Streptomyces sp. PT12]